MAPPPTPTHDPDEVRRLAEEILARDEFRPPEPGLLERIVEWIVERLDRIFGGDGGGAAGAGGSGGSAAFTVLLLLAAAVAVVLLALWLRRVWVPRRKRGDEEEAGTVAVDERRPAEAWEALADRLEAEGRWKEAMRARFGALVERLAEGGVVADIPGRTTGEYRADVRASLPEAADAFAEAADLFDRAWYGDLPTGPEEAERFVAGAGRVLAATGGRR